jgi:hypothetical protein
VGGEITTILEADRHRLLKAAREFQRDDSPEQRDPEMVARLAAARHQQGLSARHAPRYDTL